jgi:poly-gamma-glutamate synthesis protein (capsule biosynthesis protein)
MDPKVVITIFLCGDVMIGRGIDQILPHPGDPTLHEPYVRSASSYLQLAEAKNGPIKRPADFGYIWGDALDQLERVRPGLRLVNLETSVTTCRDFWGGKEVHYRVHPQNISCLKHARIDCCVVANNHVLDFGYTGLVETLKELEDAGIKHVGAGRNAEQAAAPAVLDVRGKGRVLVFALGSPTSGVPPEWAASTGTPGVNLLPDLSDRSVQKVSQSIRGQARRGDLVIVSIHWGSNWGYHVPEDQVAFAHGLIDRAGVHVVHGHSSHHVKGLEVYRGRLILYGCGDLLNDYEGIAGEERYRPDLSLMYFPSLDASTGALTRLEMAPMRIRNFRLNRVSREDTTWLQDVLNRESAARGVRVRLRPEGMLTAEWERPVP